MKQRTHIYQKNAVWCCREKPIDPCSCKKKMSEHFCARRCPQVGFLVRLGFTTKWVSWNWSRKAVLDFSNCSGPLGASFLSTSWGLNNGWKHVLTPFRYSFCSEEAYPGPGFSRESFQATHFVDSGPAFCREKIPGPLLNGGLQPHLPKSKGDTFPTNSSQRSIRSSTCKKKSPFFFIFFHIFPPPFCFLTSRSWCRAVASAVPPAWAASWRTCHGCGPRPSRLRPAFGTASTRTSKISCEVAEGIERMTGGGWVGILRGTSEKYGVRGMIGIDWGWVYTCI